MITIQKITEKEMMENNIIADKCDILFGLNESGKLKGFMGAEIKGNSLLINTLSVSDLTLAEIDGTMRALLNQVMNMGITEAYVLDEFETVFNELRFFTAEDKCDIKAFFEMGCSHE